MAESDSHSHALARSQAATSAEKATLIGTLAHLWPYIWPGDRADLKMRVAWSVVLLLLAFAINDCVLRSHALVPTLHSQGEEC